MVDVLPPTGVPVLSLRGVRKSFGGVEVLHGIDLDIHPGTVVALLGENGAGKSTLVKIVSGDYQADDGTIIVDGVVHSQMTPQSASELGIGMIYQELNDAPSLTVAENISLGKLPNRMGFVDWRQVRSRARAVLEELEVDLDIDRPVSTLRVGQRQVIEIARALVDQAKILVLDEPTAALSGEETATLFRYIRRLRERGTAMIYITHRLDELKEVADDVVVLRDGHVKYRGSVADSPRADLVEAMVGARLADAGRPAPAGALGEVVASFDGATSPGAFTDVDLEVRAGEVVALYGKVGSGIAEVCEAAFGTLPVSSGSIVLNGGYRPKSPRHSVRANVGYLPADRKSEGAFGILTSARNLGAASWSRDARASLWADAGAENEAFERWRDELNIKVSPQGANRPIFRLSGGNQQKVLLARWLHADSSLMLLVEPTRGVDVGARQDIYQALRDLAADGIGILVATSDSEEVVHLADRAVVMARGEVVRELSHDEVTLAALTDAAGG
ncbi:sugar ABC transporter ATP-binding protein [Tessaracoccus sp. MC1865]|uniref:sugar ABC transporter ATP-binding protein n=1 Tax=Tessaracoccus sp. MC1865 TaxID=2760310 RepID=UPI00160231D9|nr:sugar ABC transporter ATP-binding protein [Tessaracoccus sp. MC1865]MBB1482919.1 sugar ABC transporter ATP-binding protein [Tessaracoccus sp. MC1865]QTO37642.1 sugar ABC transporter ATP-binding protein [Tessaracoccus sp. MC1865]